MKRRLSGWEKAFVAVPLAGALLAWNWGAARHAWYQVFPRTVLPLGPGDLEAARFSPDGTLIALDLHEWETPLAPQITRLHNGIEVRDAGTGEMLWHTPLGPADKQRGFQEPVFSPDSKLLLFCDVRETWPALGPVISNTTLWLYEAVSGKPLHSYAVGNVQHARFVDGGRKIFCDGTPSLIIDAVTGKRLASTYARGLGHGRRPFSADGKTGLLLRECGGAKGRFRRMEVWDFSAPRKVREFQGSYWHGSSFDGWVRILALSPDGKSACTAADGQGVAEMWDVAAGRVVGGFPVKDLDSLTYAPDSRTILARSGPQQRTAARPDRISLMDARTGAALWTQTAPLQQQFKMRAFANVQFSPDGKFVVTSGSEGDVRWLDIRSGKVKLRCSDADVVLFSPDGQKMALHIAQGANLLPSP